MQRDWTCSFPPDQLRDALQAQQWRGDGMEHNEVVIDTRSVMAQLPGAVQAFFYLTGSTSDDVNLARGVQGGFLREYGLSPERVPLLRLDLWGGEDGRTPFDYPLCDWWGCQ